MALPVTGTLSTADASASYGDLQGLELRAGKPQIGQQALGRNDRENGQPSLHLEKVFVASGWLAEQCDTFSTDNA